MYVVTGNDAYLTSSQKRQEIQDHLTSTSGDRVDRQTVKPKLFASATRDIAAINALTNSAHPGACRSDGNSAQTMHVQVETLRKELKSLAEDTFLRDFSELANNLREDMRELCEDVRLSIKREIPKAVCNRNASPANGERRGLEGPGIGVSMAEPLSVSTSAKFAKNSQETARINRKGNVSDLRIAAKGNDGDVEEVFIPLEEPPVLPMQMIDDDDDEPKSPSALKKARHGSSGSRSRSKSETDSDDDEMAIRPTNNAADEAAGGGDTWVLSQKRTSSVDSTDHSSYMAVRASQHKGLAPSKAQLADGNKVKKGKLSKVHLLSAADGSEEDKPAVQSKLSWCSKVDSGKGMNSMACNASLPFKPLQEDDESDLALPPTRASHASSQSDNTSATGQTHGEGKAERASQKRLGLDMELARVQTKKKNSQTARIEWRHLTAQDILNSQKFDNLVGCLILVNAVTIGVQTDAMAKSLTDVVPETIQHLEKVFLVLFSMELSLRLYVYKFRFFTSGDKLWNWFDFTVVVMQLFEEFLLLAVGDDGTSDSTSKGADKIKLIRVMRILRLMRILRVMRVLRLISELRTIVSSIVGSMKSLAWTIVLLSLFIYIVSVYFTQSINDHLVELEVVNSDAFKIEEAEQEIQDLRIYFGSLGSTVLSLYQAMSGGLDWDTLARPLIEEVGVGMGLCLVAYIAFAVLALMNVVTGVFVQTALQSAKVEEDKFMTDQICRLFTIGERQQHHQKGKIDWTQVEEIISDPRAAREWRSIDVQPEEAKYLFFLLDIESSGEVHFEEFLSGCLRLHGPAKAIDLLTVMQELRSYYVKEKEFQQEMRDAVSVLNQQIMEIQGVELWKFGDHWQNMKSDFDSMTNKMRDDRRINQELRRQLQEIQDTTTQVEQHLGAFNQLFYHAEKDFSGGQAMHDLV